jgi:hypothetical protein
MTKRFQFHDAFWFRVPLKTVVVGLCVFGILTLWPALWRNDAHDQARAAFGLVVLGSFTVLASIFTVAVNDGYANIDDGELIIRFEAFFNARVPLTDIIGVRPIDPRPHWRYRFGLSTNFHDRISCSHGGSLVEVELAQPCVTKLWPRHIAVRRFWLGVREPETFIANLREAAEAAQQGERRLSRAA